MLTRDPHAQFPATLTKVVVHLRSIQSAMCLLLSRPKVTPVLRDGRKREEGYLQPASGQNFCCQSQNSPKVESVDPISPSTDSACDNLCAPAPTSQPPRRSR